MNTEFIQNGDMENDPSLFDFSENSTFFIIKDPVKSNDSTGTVPQDEDNLNSVPLVFLDDGQMIFDSGDSLIDTDSCDMFLQQSFLQNQILDLMDTEVGIEAEGTNKLDADLADLVDIPNMFKCKECPYLASQKPELVQHFINLHGEKMFATNPGFDDAPVPTEKEVGLFIFLCGQCTKQFLTLEDCREHMVKDHSCTARKSSKKLNLSSDFGMNKENNDLVIIGNRLTDAKKIDGNIPLDETANSNKNKTDKAFENTKKKRKLKNCNDHSPHKIMRTYTNGLTEEEEEKLLLQKTLRNKNIKCPKRGCVYRFSTNELLDKHLECHIPQGNPRDFQCCHCEQRFERWHGCALHLWHTHKIDVDMLTCSHCQVYKTVTQVKLSNHMRIHAEERSFSCPICGKGFKQQAQLRNHQVHHMDRTSMHVPRWYAPQKCPLCSKSYADSKSLKKHIQAVHSKLKPYVCHVCGHSAARKAMLQLHMRQHTGEKPYVCPLCDYRTGDHNSLRRHKMRHSGTRPYNCPHCSASFIQSVTYKNHLSARHPGKEGVYSCSRCMFHTITKESLDKHESDHDCGLIPDMPENTGGNGDVFPGNVAAAHLLYRCFNATPPDIKSTLTSSSISADGNTQTITIQLPAGSQVSLEDDSSQCFPSSQDDDTVIDTGGITTPAEPTTL